MNEAPNMWNPGIVDGFLEPRPLRRKELLLKTPEMRIPSIIITQSELRLERPKELLERMERSRSRSASKISPKSKFLTPEYRQRTWAMSESSTGEPLRSKELLELQRSRQHGGLAAKLAYYQTLSSPVRRKDHEELLKTPERSTPVNSHSEIRLERPKELLKRLETSKHRSASTSKIHSKNIFLTPENEQQSVKEPRTPEMRCPCSAEPSWEVRPLRTRELLERQRQATITSRSASASKIATERTKAMVPASSFTSSRLLVPSIGFSYPKDPTACRTYSAHSTKPPSKLTNTRRSLFRHETPREALCQKLERISGEWPRMSQRQLQQLIVDFVNLCLPSSGAKCSHLSRDCYVNQLMEALQRLQYPKEVNKTWLRTPKSQQAIGHVLEILHFLLDFAPEQEEGICVFPIVPDGKQIVEQAARAFRSSQGGIEQKVASPVDASGTSYDLISLQQELETLNLQPDPDSDLCSELYALQREKQRLQEELANCQAEIKSSASETAEKMQKLGDLNKANLARGKLLDGLKEQVRNQTCNLQDLLDQQEELTHELQLHRLRLQKFAERLRLGKLKLKRCQKEQKLSIEAFNVQIRDYEYSLASKSSYPISLQLSSNATLPEIEEIVMHLRGFPWAKSATPLIRTHKVQVNLSKYLRVAFI